MEKNKLEEFNITFQGELAKAIIKRAEKDGYSYHDRGFWLRKYLAKIWGLRR